MDLEWLTTALVFVALTAYVLLRRDPVKGWFLVMTGATACLAGAVWNFSLSDKEVMDVIVKAVIIVDQHVRGVIIDFVRSLGAAPPSILATDLQSWSQRAGPLAIAAFLFGSYFITSRPVAFVARQLVYAVANLLLQRHAPPGVTSTSLTLRAVIKAVNKRVAADAGARVLTSSLMVAVAFFTVSVLARRPSELLPLAGIDLNPFAVNREVFWLGLFILSAELGGQLYRVRNLERPAPERPGKPAASKQAAAASGVQPLSSVYLNAVKGYGGYILFKEHGVRKDAQAADELPSTAENGKESFALRAIARLLQDNTNWSKGEVERETRVFRDFIFIPGPDDSVRRSRLVVIHEPLHPVHLSMIFALCEHQQSQGRVSLVICPKHLVHYVETSFKASASQSLASLVQRGAVLDGSRIALQGTLSFSYVIVADTDFERELLGPGEGREFLLDNLCMVAVIEAESLQASRLKLQLPRLWRRVPRERVKVLIQVGSLENYRRLTEGLLRLEENEVSSPPWSAGFAQFTSTHKLVWDAGREMADSLLPECSTVMGRPVAAVIGVVAFAAKNGEPACRDDAAGRLNQSEFDAVSGRLSRDLVSRISDASEPNAGEKARVVIVDEDASILRTIARFYDRYGHGDILLNIVTHDYPLRDYHVDLLKHHGSAAIVGAGAQMAADPQGGVREMLATLYDALRERRGVNPEDGGLLRSQIIEHLSLLPRELQKQINLIPGRKGITHLFNQLNVNPQIIVRREEGDTRYEIDTGSRDEFPELHFSVPVKAYGVERFRVPAGDVGLTIFPNRNISHDGQEYRVDSVSRVRIDARADTASRPKTTAPVLDYIFTDTDSGSVPPPGRTAPAWLLDTPSEGGPVSSSHYYGSFIRRTMAVIAYDKDEAPLGDAFSFGDLASSMSVPHEQRRDYQSVWHLRFNGSMPLMRDKGPAEVAFTMCVVLQDVVRALFPRWPHRLNVVSPMATEVFKRHRDVLLRLPGAVADEKCGRVDALLAGLYPRLATRAGTDGREPSAGTATAPGTAAGLDLYLIEDSDFDLGVVRRLHSSRELLFDKMTSYLKWLKEDKAGGRYHRFGAKRDSSLLVYNEVLRLIEQ